MAEKAELPGPGGGSEAPHTKAGDGDPPPGGEVKARDEENPEVTIECAVCLQNCVYPVQLPCKHIFCFLCVKGVTLQSKRCAMCRREIPPDYLHNPELLSQLGLETGAGFEDGGQWFYEGRNGWWLYDERTSQEIEAAWSNDEQRCELLIAGFLYIIDFEHMLQYRRNDPSRRRRIKRDQASGPKKGVAGLRMETTAEVDPATADAAESSDDVVDGSPSVVAGASDPAADLADALEDLSVEQAAEDEEEDHAQASE